MRSMGKKRNSGKNESPGRSGPSPKANLKTKELVRLYHNELRFKRNRRRFRVLHTVDQIKEENIAERKEQKQQEKEIRKEENCKKQTEPGFLSFIFFPLKD